MREIHQVSIIHLIFCIIPIENVLIILLTIGTWTAAMTKMDFQTYLGQRGILKE